MEKFQELREKAVRSVKVADHMLTVSYPLLNDPKILVAVANNLLQAVDYGMMSVLEHEKLFKRIMTYPDTIQGRYALFKQRVLKSNNDKKFVIVSELLAIVDNHKASLVEFPRQDKFVIANDSYELRTLTVKELKDYLVKVREIVEQLYEMTRKNDGIFR